MGARRELSALPRDWFDRPVLDVARSLLGCVLEHRTPAGSVAVRLTEVEGYAGEEDPGSHAFRGRTARNATMFGPGGHAYVYFTYGMHYCVNVVCGPAGIARAVLLRAGEVVSGRPLARERRPGSTDRDLARGPARLTKALGIGREHDGADLAADAGPLRLLPGDAVVDDLVRTGPRVGVAGAGAPTPWRFWVAGEPSVSAYRPAVRRRRAVR
ncbi:MAG: DNA-3-methyladenine glycosylase [Frankiaceae bacterium]